VDASCNTFEELMNRDALVLHTLVWDIIKSMIIEDIHLPIIVMTTPALHKLLEVDVEANLLL